MKNLRKLTYAEVSGIAIAVVDRVGPEFVYEAPEFKLYPDDERPYMGSEDATTTQCAYFNSAGEPSCIVGHIMAELGVTSDDAESFNQDTVVDCVPWEKLGLNLDNEAFNFLSTLQSEQDAEKCWGTALNVARKQIECGDLEA